MNAFASSNLRPSGYTKRFVLTLVFASLIGGCAGPTSVATGPFKDLTRIGAELRRGVSTKTDVERLLGRPTGHGELLEPTTEGTAWVRREVWYYEDIEMTGLDNTRREGTVTILPLRMRQQVVLIFFDKDRFDGDFWFSNAQQSEIYGR